MIGIVVSRADPVSEQVAEHLLELAEWKEREDDTRSAADGGGTYYRADGFALRTFEALHLELDGAADAFDDPELIVFASRHAGETGPLLTAHHTGNFGPAEYGGSDHELATACPAAHARILDSLDASAPDDYETGMECTHHGPSDVGAPSMFVEHGSGEEQWGDEDAARAVARAILDLRGIANEGCDLASGRRALVGFGGGHYAPRFERIVRETGWSVGHVAADWCLDAMGDPDERRDVIDQAFEKSGADYAVIDGERPGLASVVEDLGYRTVSERWIREVDGVPLSFVERVEDRLRPVEAGLRFGDPAVGHEGEFVVVELPSELLAEAVGIDAERTRSIVAAHALAFETDENGNRVLGRAAFRDDSVPSELVEALVPILRERYDRVDYTDDAVVARETAFVPERARDLGVPEGPAFGRLANGESVAVDGETIAPEDVTEERTRRFSL